MSVIKNKQPQSYATPTDVRYKLSVAQFNNLHDKPSVVIACQLRGAVDGATGEVEVVPANLTISDITANFAASEKAAAKTVLKAIEREAAKKVPDLANEPHDGSDVFE